MSLKSELEDIYTAEGRLTPALVVEAARDEQSWPALHARIPWDDAAAAETHRLDVARRLIRKVRVRFIDANADRQSVRQYVHVEHIDPPEHVYRRIDEIAADPFTTQLVLREAEREWRRLKQRYGHMAEFIELVRRDTRKDNDDNAA